MLRESMTRLNTIRNYIDILIFYFCVVRIVDEFYGKRGGGGERKKSFVNLSYTAKLRLHRITSRSDFKSLKLADGQLKVVSI